MLKKGGLRLLTPGEIRLATELYGRSIRYNRVWVHHGSYLPLGMQENNTAMTPSGEIWFETNVYRDDHSKTLPDAQHLFMHEMMHIWQYQRGMNVKTRGLFSWAVNYKYNFNKKMLSGYPMEQQASIVADYWLLTRFGFNGYERIINYAAFDKNEPKGSLIAKYKKVLGGFPL